MTKKLQEITLSFFLVVCSISILLGMLWLKPIIETQRQLIEETRINQEKIMEAAEKTRLILTELGYATTVLVMMENRIIQPSDANRMIDASVKKIEAHSERLGKLARLINEFRINEQTRR